MLLTRSLIASVVLGLLAANSCFSVDERDFGPIGDAGLDGAVGDSGGTGGSGGDAGVITCTSSSDCDDGNWCNGTETCNAGTCAAGSAQADRTACTVQTGTSVQDVPGLCFDGACLQSCTTVDDCDDGNPCTGQETCDGSRGVCVTSGPPNCEDGDDCTDDVCDPMKGDPTNNYCLNKLRDGDGDGHASDILGPCGDDCNDADPAVYAGAPELCDSRDNDCDGNAETTQPYWYIDCDLDGFSESTAGAIQGCSMPTQQPCGIPDAWTLTAPNSRETTDCFDGDANQSPAAEEVCDGIDNDCSGVEDDVAPAYWRDCDLDYYAAADAPIAYACEQNQGPPAFCPSGGWTTIEPRNNNVDCDDNNSSISPGVAEDCTTPNYIDDNCDGAVDAYVWYRDCDGDHVSPSTDGSTVSCDTPAAGADGCNWTRTYPDGSQLDCDDANALVYPNAWYQTTPDPVWGWDYNCDGDESKEYTGAGVDPNASCALNGDFFLFCSGDDGWTGAEVPNCGETAEATLCNCDTTSCSGGIICIFCSSCSRTTAPTVQPCR